MRPTQMILAAATVLSCALGCATTPPKPDSPAVPFRYASHFLTVPVSLSRGATTVETRFVLDTGIGVSLISKALCERLGCKVTGEHTGKRMSGQEIRVPLATVPSVRFGARAVKDLPVGVFDLGDDLPGIEGFLSLGFFDGAGFTVDYAASSVVIEDAASLAARAAKGTAISVEVKREGPVLTVFLPLVVAERDALVEVDTGSNAVILHDRYLELLGVQRDDPKVRRAEGKDETGNTFVRHFAVVSGPFAPRGAPAVARKDLKVMFQTIIYDGLVGDAFLRQFTVTYDLAGSQMIFARP